MAAPEGPLALNGVGLTPLLRDLVMIGGGGRRRQNREVREAKHI